MLFIRGIPQESLKLISLGKFIVLSINDYADPTRSVSVDTLYANNAYINTPATNFKVEDGIVTNYAEFRNADKLGVVDNDFRRLIKGPDIQLYNAQTGSFGLDFDGTINMRTTAPTVYNEPHKLVNGYHSEWNFVNKGQKESKDLKENIELTEALNTKYEESLKRVSMNFDTRGDIGLISNYKIYDISTKGAIIDNAQNLQPGAVTKLNIKFDDTDIDVEAKVVSINGGKANLEFINLPKDVANKILYRYMQKKGTMKISKR